jgi:phage protein U
VNAGNFDNFRGANYRELQQLRQLRHSALARYGRVMSESAP